MRAASTHFISVATGNYVAIGLSLAINLALTRSLGPARFGHLALLLTGSQLLAVFAANWSTTTLVRYGSAEYATTGRLTRAFWARGALMVPWILGATTTLVALANPIASFLDVPPPALAVVFTHFLATTAFFTLGGVLQAAARMPAYAILLVAERVVAAGLVLVAVAVLAADELAILIAFAVSAVSTALVVAFFMRREIGLPRVDPDRLGVMWAYSVPLIISTWAGLFGSQWSDYLFIRRVMTVADLGHYSLAYQLAGVTQQITIVVYTLLLPRLSALVGSGRASEIGPILGRVLPYWLLALTSVVAAALVAATFLVSILFGADFSRSIGPLSILLVSTVALAVTNALTPLLAAHGLTWLITRIMLAAAVANIAGDVLLIPRYGLNGAAFATLCANVISVSLVLSAGAVRREIRTARFALFALPVLAAYASSLLFQGIALVMVATIGIGASGLIIVRAFDLFRSSDLALLRLARTPAAALDE